MKPLRVIVGQVIGDANIQCKILQVEDNEVTLEITSCEDSIYKKFVEVGKTYKAKLDKFFGVYTLLVPTQVIKDKGNVELYYENGEEKVTVLDLKSQP